MNNNITKFNESIVKINFFESFLKALDLKDLDIVRIDLIVTIILFNITTNIVKYI
jgi:hypothetical protein